MDTSSVGVKTIRDAKRFMHWPYYCLVWLLFHVLTSQSLLSLPMKSFKQGSRLPAPQAPRRCQDLAFLECRTRALAALWAIWAVSLLEKPFSEELFPGPSFCSVPTGFHYQTYSLCHPCSTQGLQTGTSWLIDPTDTQPPQEPKNLHQSPCLSKQSKSGNS